MLNTVPAIPTSGDLFPLNILHPNAFLYPDGGEERTSLSGLVSPQTATAIAVDTLYPSATLYPTARLFLGGYNVTSEQGDI